jgi:predicted small secreted protein
MLRDHRHTARFALLAILFATCAAVLSACTTLGALVGNQVTFTAPQLQASLDRRFPRDYDKLGGLVTVRLMHPRLTIPEGSGQLQLDFDLGFGGLGMTPSATSGHFALRSGLRFDSGTRGLHLADPAIVGIDVPALGGAMNDTARGLLNTWLAEYAREEPVYRLDDNAWSRLAGRRIGDTTIGDGRVVLHLDQ